MRKHKAFTLIEMLIVTAMLAVISLAVYSTLNSGTKVWRRINMPIRSEDLDVCFEKVALDLRNCMDLENIGFFGSRDAFQFATLVDSRKMGGAVVGGVKYKFDQQGGEFKRYAADYSDVYEGHTDPEEVLLRGVRSISVSYYKFDTEKQKYLWLDDWKAEGLPLAVKLELEVGADDISYKYTKIVSIPVA